ncbi:hypothetical protein Avbf_17237 [Armadillidium vulgare]|nr:hypothetical protein Avbf_17237 [Armadillidium vulgare]
MSNLFAYVQFLDDKSRNVVPVKDIKHFDPKTLEDFSKKKKFLKSTGLRKTIKPILKNMKDQYMKGTILYLGDGEVYLPKRKVYEYENKIINQKKKIKTLQNEMEVLKSRNAYLETDYDTLKEKLNRYESNAGIEESSCKEMLKVLLQETTEIKASLKTTLEGIFIMIYKNKYEIIFGSISFPEKPFLTISRRPKHSLFVKDLVSLLWSDEDLSQLSLTGKKHFNSKEIKQPLTPEKRFAIEEAFKDRLKKQQYHDAMIALELKLVNRYIA